MNFPVNFETLARAARSASAGGYPAQISAADLMRNFVHAALETEEGLVTTCTGEDGYPQRKLTIPSPAGENKILGCNGSHMAWVDDIPAAPTTGTWVLGAVDGVLTWIETEAC